MVNIKICGITNERDAIYSAEFGADYLGFLVEIPSSVDTISREEAKRIIRKIPLEVIPVLVTYLDKADNIIELAEFVKPAVIQLHKEIEIGEIGLIRKALPKVKITYTIHVENDDDIKNMRDVERYVDYILLDTIANGRIGGTGKTHDWNISRRIVRQCKKPVFLAGGLNPENVIEAIAKVKPFGVDVNTGVKSKPRVKDYNKLRQFIERAKMMG